MVVVEEVVVGDQGDLELVGGLLGKSNYSAADIEKPLKIVEDVEQLGMHMWLVV